MNLLFCSVGRRGELIKYFQAALEEDSRIIATDNDNTAPALYFADKQYIVPRVTDEEYIETILAICQKERIHAITTFIDLEIEVLAKNREKFEEVGVELLVPYLKTAQLCFDKYKMYQYLVKNDIKTIKTYDTFDDFNLEYTAGNITFPVFVKPRSGSGSVGARKISTIQKLKIICALDEQLIIQEFMEGIDIDVDVYVDTINQKAVSMFSKKKLETRIGGANKTISFIDERLHGQVQELVSKFTFNGPIDLDYFYVDGEYYLIEINPRFGGAYLHAHACGIDFTKLIQNNLNGIANEIKLGNYEEDVLMMMYDSVVIKKKTELVSRGNHE